MTPGFAKSRAEMPWLYYPENDRVIINAHNFGGSSYDSDAAAYFAAVEAVSDFDLTAINAWATASYVKGHINKLVVVLKSDGVWTDLLDSALFVGPRTIAGAYVKLRGSSVCSIIGGTMSYNAAQGITPGSGASSLTTGQTFGGSKDSCSAWIWTHTAYITSNNRYLSFATSSISHILGGASSLGRFRANSGPISSVGTSSFSDNLIGFSRTSSTNINWVTAASSGSVSLASGSPTFSATEIFAQDSTTWIGAGATVAGYGVGNGLDLTKVRDRFAAYKAALATETAL